jgi:hypothetical protein
VARISEIGTTLAETGTMRRNANSMRNNNYTRKETIELDTSEMHERRGLGEGLNI